MSLKRTKKSLIQNAFEGSNATTSQQLHFMIKLFSSVTLNKEKMAYKWVK